MLPLHRLTTLITGKIQLADELGNVASYVYQRTSPGSGNLFLTERNDRILRTNPVPAPSNTVKQQRARNRWRDAVEAWHLLLPEVQDTYTARAERMRFTGLNLFIREYCRDWPITIDTAWHLHAFVLGDAGIPNRPLSAFNHLTARYSLGRRRASRNV